MDNLTPEYRANLRRLKDCIQHKHIDRVPHFSNIYTWKILDSDLKPKLSEAMSNYTLLDKMQCEFQERYHFDVHFDLLNRNLLKPETVMGGNHHLINDEAESINFFDHVLMNADEYEEYAKDPMAVNWKMFRRKYPDITAGQVAKAMALREENIAYVDHMKKKFRDKYSSAFANGRIVAQVPYERFHKYYRGIKEATMDLRRRKSVLHDVFDSMMENEIMPNLKKQLETFDDSDCMCDVMMPFLSHAMMNNKQWDEFYWPYLKPQIDMIAEHGKTILIYCENSLLRFAEYFQDYPKGLFLIVPELDDVRDIRKAIPNAAVAGGLTTDLLGHGTPEECVDAAKRAIDDMGDGFMLSQNKMVSFRNDCRRENLLAVCEYVQSYRC